MYSDRACQCLSIQTYPIDYSVISCALVTFTGVEKVEQDYEQYEQFSARSFLNLRYHYNCVIVLIELILDLRKTSSFIYMIISFSNILSDIPSDKYQVANGILRMFQNDQEPSLIT